MQFSQFLETYGKPVQVEAEEHLFRQGEDHGSLYAVRQGLLKAYYLSGEGKEHIKSFIQPGDFIGSLTASYAGQSSSFSLVCLQPAELIRLDFNQIYAASRDNANIAGLVVDFLLAFAMKKERREYELLCLSAEDRYRELLKTTPHIMDMVTQNEIALYLGVTPVGLSRIKKRVTDAS